MAEKKKNLNPDIPFEYMDMQEVGIRGFREHMVEGLKHGVVEFRRLPGEFKRVRVYDADNKHYHLAPKSFIPNPQYPDGVHYSFPAWFILLIGIPAFMIILKALGFVLPGFDFGKDAWYPGKGVSEALTGLQRDILFPEGMKEIDIEEEEANCRIWYDMGTELNDIPGPIYKHICKKYYKKWNKESEV